jgi:hypothetical protein
MPDRACPQLDWGSGKTDRDKTHLWNYETIWNAGAQFKGAWIPACAGITNRNYTSVNRNVIKVYLGHNNRTYLKVYLSGGVECRLKPE